MKISRWMWVVPALALAAPDEGAISADLDYDPATGFWKIKKIYTGDYPTDLVDQDGYEYMVNERADAPYAQMLSVALWPLSASTPIKGTFDLSKEPFDYSKCEHCVLVIASTSATDQKRLPDPAPAPSPDGERHRRLLHHLRRSADEHVQPCRAFDGSPVGRGQDGEHSRSVEDSWVGHLGGQRSGAPGRAPGFRWALGPSLWQ